MKGSTILKQILKAINVEYIFGVLGRESQFISFDPIEKPKFILVRNEQSAGIMAESYARLTGRPQVCLSTLGPGLTNLMTGVASSYKERSPVIAISFQCETYENKPDAHQCLDNLEIMKPIVKIAFEPKSIQELIEQMDKFFNILFTKPYGPCFISIPIDVLNQDYPYKNQPISIKNFQHKGVKSFDKINAIYDEISKARQPLIICGYEAMLDKNPQSLLKFAEKHNISVATNLAGKGAFPENHRLSIGAISKYYEYFFNISLQSELFDKVDLIIFIGFNYAEDFTPKIWNNPNPPTICSINSYQDSLEKHLPLKINAYESLIYETLDSLSRKPSAIKNNTINIKKIKNAKNHFLALERTKKLSCFSIIEAVENLLKPEDILVVDVGLHKHIAGLTYNILKPLTYIGSHGLATMGFALPAAIGAKLAHPEKNVVAICGDGGFHSTIQELETSIRYNINITVIVFNNSNLRLIDYYHFLGYKNYEPHTTNFTCIDFKKIAEAIGCNAFKVKTTSKFISAFKKTTASRKTTVIEIPIKY